jgi:CMP-N-acetylneuraminic acid synthetase
VTPAFHPNGAIYVGPVERFLATQSFFVSPIIGTLLPPERALDLDHPHQWEIAEVLAQTHL